MTPQKFLVHMIKKTNINACITCRHLSGADLASIKQTQEIKDVFNRLAKSRGISDYNKMFANKLSDKILGHIPSHPNVLKVDIDQTRYHLYYTHVARYVYLHVIDVKNNVQTCIFADN